MFPYNSWIRKSETALDELVFELPTIRPDIAPRATTRYCVAVTTGDEPRADTDATVYCTLVGRFGDTGRRLLLRATNHDGATFRRNQVSLMTSFC